MKFNKIILSVAASAMLLTGCDDQIMEWGRQDGHYPATADDIPLEIKEVLSNYDNIKVYAAEYHPNMILGLGIGAAIYLGDDGRGELANNNFQMITLGNAMKHDAIVSGSGGLRFETVDEVIDAIQQVDMKLYGHNFFWYQQQQQGYLKSLIAPKYVSEQSSDIQTLLGGDAATFDGGTSGGWGSWGSNKADASVVDGVGVDGTPAMVLSNKGDGNAWEAQFAYTFATPLNPETEYTIRFQARSDAPGQLQFQYQNGSTYGSQGGYNTFSTTTEWQTFEYSFTPAYDDADRIILNFGAVGGTYYIDNIEFGIKEEDPMENVLAGDASDFEGGTTGGWGSWGSNKADAAVVEGEGYKDSYGLVLTNNGDGNAWEAQNAYTFDTPLQQDKKYIIQFYAKASTDAGYLQFQYQNSTTYGSQGGYTDFAVTTEWQRFEKEFIVAPDDADRIILNFGKIGGTYYVDNIKFGLAKNQDGETGSSKVVRFVKSNKLRKAPGGHYELKTPEEKREALLGAMEAWVKGMADHLKEKGVTPAGYDVINEPITDGNGNKVRGVDNVFGGSTTDDDGNTTYDSAPTESESEDLNLNWGSNRFYWGYYVPDYAVKAFQYARLYLPAETKLFVNDYNLETSPSKLAALIEFVKKIDADNGSPIVDGIGTQMHITLSGTSDDTENNAQKVAELREKVDTQFKTLAATGKLIRVTELDIALGTSSPSAAQHKAQSDAYKAVFESYFENVPEAQQNGITIWSLTDAEDEHEYWLKGETPNLFDANFLRKWAYKGVCDAIAGEDLGLKFGSSDYKTYYERQNVSESVK